MSYARRIAVPLGVALALAIDCPAALAQAQKTYTLKFNHVLGPREPYHEGFQNWAKRVGERTKGGLKMDVFHSAQLGNEEDIIEQIRQGANIGQNTDSARMGNYVPGIAIMNGPYFAETLDDVAKLAKSRTIMQWQDELATKHGLKVVCFNWVQGYRHFFTNKPVKTPADLGGQRIRTPPAPIWQELVRALGAAPVALAFGEMYPALQQRAIDGVELVYNNIPGGRFYEVLKHASETRHIMLINFEVVSAKFFNELPRGVPDRAHRGMRARRRGNLAAHRQARGGGEGPTQEARHDRGRRRRPRGVPQGRREGLRGAAAHRRQERRAQGDRKVARPTPRQSRMTLSSHPTLPWRAGELHMTRRLLLPSPWGEGRPPQRALARQAGGVGVGQIECSGTASIFRDDPHPDAFAR